MTPGQCNNSVLLSFFLPVIFENQRLIWNLLDVDIDGPSELTHDAADLNKLVIFTWWLISIASTVNKEDRCKRLSNKMRENHTHSRGLTFFLKIDVHNGFSSEQKIYHDILCANLASFDQIRAEE